MHRNLYAIGTILAPQHKLQFISSREWGKDPEWRAKYKADLQEFMEPYQRRLSKTQLPVNVPRQKTSDMEDLFNDGVSINATANAGFDDELAQYLESGMQCKTFYYEYPLILLNSLATKNVDPLVFWRDHRMNSQSSQVLHGMSFRSLQPVQAWNVFSTLRAISATIVGGLFMRQPSKTS